MKMISPNKTKRVLIVHPFGIGDALFITPVLRSLYSEGFQQIDLLLGSRTRELFEANPFVREIFEWDKSPLATWSDKFRRLKEVIVLFQKLRSRRYEILIDFSLSRPYAFWAQFVWNIPIRVGFNYKGRGTFLTHSINLKEGFSSKRVPEYYASLLATLHLSKPAGTHLEFYLTDDDLQAAMQIFRQNGIPSNRPFAVAAIGGGESWGRDAHLKRWPASFFMDLLRQINFKFPDVFNSVILLGGRGEKTLGDTFRPLLKQMPVYNLCGTTTLRETAAIIKNAAFVIGNDSGIVHLGNALKRPIISIFGPVEPAVYGPQPLEDVPVLAISKAGVACRPCYRNFRYNSSCKTIECLQDLTPEEVFTSITSSRFFEKILKRRNLLL